MECRKIFVTGCYAWGEHLDSFRVILELMQLSVHMTANGYDECTPSSHTCINQALIMQNLSCTKQ